MSTADNNPRRRAEVHAARAEQLLEQAAQAFLDAGQQVAPHQAGMNEREAERRMAASRGLLGRHDRLTARAQAEALTAIALGKVGGR